MGKTSVAVHLANLNAPQSSSFWLQAGEPFTISCRLIPADAESVLEQLPPLLVEDAVVVVDSATGLTNATRTVMVLADRVLPQADRVVAAFATANSGRVHWGHSAGIHKLLQEAIAIRKGKPWARSSQAIQGSGESVR